MKHVIKTVKGAFSYKEKTEVKSTKSSSYNFKYEDHLIYIVVKSTSHCQLGVSQVLNNHDEQWQEEVSFFL